jgi:hypothetical protein
MSQQQDPLVAVFQALIALQQKIDNQDNQISLMHEKLDSCLAMGQFLKKPSTVEVPKISPKDMVPTCKGNGWIKYTKQILVSRWNTDDDEADAVFNVLLQLAKKQVKSLGPVSYVSGSKKSWKNVRPFIKDELITNLEDEVAGFDVYLQHCKGHWLARRLLSRTHNDHFRKRKGNKSKKATTATTASNSDL